MEVGKMNNVKVALGLIGVSVVFVAIIVWVVSQYPWVIP